VGTDISNDYRPTDSSHNPEDYNMRCFFVFYYATLIHILSMSDYVDAVYTTIFNTEFGLNRLSIEGGIH
jgi:hypothetical protein